MSDVSFDMSRSNGSDASDTWIVKEFGASNNLISSQSGSFLDINNWVHVGFGDQGVYKVVIESDGSGFRPYGVDNVGFAPAPAPEPASMLALGMGAAWIVRRRAAKKSA